MGLAYREVQKHMQKPKVQIIYTAIKPSDVDSYNSSMALAKVI